MERLRCLLLLWEIQIRDSIIFETIFYWVNFLSIVQIKFRLLFKKFSVVIFPINLFQSFPLSLALTSTFQNVIVVWDIRNLTAFWIKFLKENFQRKRLTFVFLSWRYWSLIGKIASRMIYWWLFRKVKVSSRFRVTMTWMTQMIQFIIMLIALLQILMASLNLGCMGIETCPGAKGSISDKILLKNILTCKNMITLSIWWRGSCWNMISQAWVVYNPWWLIESITWPLCVVWCLNFWFFAWIVWRLEGILKKFINLLISRRYSVLNNFLRTYELKTRILALYLCFQIFSITFTIKIFNRTQTAIKRNKSILLQFLFIKRRSCWVWLRWIIYDF